MKLKDGRRLILKIDTFASSVMVNDESNLLHDGLFLSVVWCRIGRDFNCGVW